MPIPIKPVHSLDLHAELFDGPSMEGLGLSDIQIQKIYCEDTLLKGKVFNFIIKEFKKTSIATHTFSNSSLVFLPSKKVNPGNCKQSHYLRPILYLIPRLSM